MHFMPSSLYLLFFSFKVEKHRHLEEDDKTHGEGGEGPVWHEGRDGLPNMPTEMIVKDQGATALCLAAMGLHMEALNQFLQVRFQQ